MKLHYLKKKFLPISRAFLVELKLKLFDVTSHFVNFYFQLQLRELFKLDWFHGLFLEAKNVILNYPILNPEMQNLHRNVTAQKGDVMLKPISPSDNAVW